MTPTLRSLVLAAAALAALSTTASAQQKTLDTVKQREEGTNFIMDQLGSFLEKQAGN